MVEMTTSSPAPTIARPSDCATRLIPSVVPRVKTISEESSAPMKRRSFSRTPSYAAVALVEAARGVDDGARLLRRRGVVQVDERFAVDPLVEYREILTDPLHVEAR